MFSNVDTYEGFRIDSHFFEKKYKENKDRLNCHKCSVLKDLVSKPIQIGHTPSMANSSYYGGAIALIKTDNLHDNYINPIFLNHLSEKGNAVIARTTLQPGDIITTIIGATEEIVARSAMVFEDILPANINQNIAHIRIDARKIAPEYVCIYLNTKYGKQYFLYLSRQTEQVNLNCNEIEQVVVPVLSPQIQKEITNIVRVAHSLQIGSRAIFEEAQSYLNNHMNFGNLLLHKESIVIKKLSTSYEESGRLDAEYYQPKYEVIAQNLNAKETVLSLCNLHDKNFVPDSTKSYLYIELADVGQSGDISGVDFQYGMDLPTRARRIVKTGQVIVSSVEGSLQSCALITDEYDGALCSTGFYVLDSDCINSETLLLLFKSEPIQALMKQRCSGTILTAISKDEFLSMPLPIIDEDIQKEIAAKVQESFLLRKQSKQLLEYAKQAVEMAIEQGEEAALEWLKDKVN